MPYDPMGSGYGRYSRGKGEYGMQSIYGYGDQGPLYNPQNPNPAPSPSAMTPNAGMTQINPQGDFFSQLAGLMGGSLGQPSQLSPAQYNYARSQYQPGGQVHGGNIQSYLTQANTAAREANRGNPMNMGRTGNGMGRTREQGAKPIQMTYGSGNTPEFEAAQAARDESNRAARAASGEGRQGFDQFAGRIPQRPASNMPKPGRPMAAPPGRAPGLMAGNSPMLGEKNPIGNMPAPRRAPRASGRASAGRNPMGASSFRDPGNNARPGVYY
jgi:hypothetical protein